MPLPKDLEAEAAELAERRARLLEEADLIRTLSQKHGMSEEKVAAILRDLQEQLRFVESRRSHLTSDGDSTTLDGMTAIDSGDFSRGVSRSQSKDHPWLVAMYNHPDKKKRLTVAAWAAKHDFKGGTASKWVSKTDPRKIPMRAAKAIEREYGVPATLASWPNGITAD